jgi:hypothetical protein
MLLTRHPQYMFACTVEEYWECTWTVQLVQFLLHFPLFNKRLALSHCLRNAPHVSCQLTEQFTNNLQFKIINS